MKGAPEARFDRLRYNRDLPPAIKERGEKFGARGGLKYADPLAVLIFAGAFPSKQRQGSLARLFVDKLKQSCYLCLKEVPGDRVSRAQICLAHGSFSQAVRFLAACQYAIIG